MSDPKSSKEKKSSLRSASRAFTDATDIQERIQIATEFFILKENFEMNLKKIKQLKADS